MSKSASGTPAMKLGVQSTNGTHVIGGFGWWLQTTNFGQILVLMSNVLIREQIPTQAAPTKANLASLLGTLDFNTKDA